MTLSLPANAKRAFLSAMVPRFVAEWRNWEETSETRLLGSSMAADQVAQLVISRTIEIFSQGQRYIPEAWVSQNIATAFGIPVDEGQKLKDILIDATQLLVGHKAKQGELYEVHPEWLLRFSKQFQFDCLISK